MSAGECSRGVGGGVGGWGGGAPHQTKRVRRAHHVPPARTINQLLLRLPFVSYYGTNLGLNLGQYLGPLAVRWLLAAGAELARR
jgi:hypothetical protein